MVASNNIDAFSRAAHEIVPGKSVSSVSGAIGVDLQDNGVLDITLGGNLSLIRIDTRSGLISYNGTTAPLQWSNANGEIDAFLDRANKTAIFGDRSLTLGLDVRHTGNSTFVRFGETLDQGVLISKTKDGTLGITTFDDRAGLRSIEIDMPKPQQEHAPKRDFDNALTFAPI